MILRGSNPDQEDGDPNPPAPPNPWSRPTAGQLFSLRAQDAPGPDASQPSSGLSVHFSPSSSRFIRVFTEESLRPSVPPQPPAENPAAGPRQGHRSPIECPGIRAAEPVRVGAWRLASRAGLLQMSAGSAEPGMLL